MDVNLTGALAANVSLMQPSKTDYLPLITQIITTLLTIAATLGGVYYAQYLLAQSEAKKHAEDEMESWINNQKEALQEFLDVFSRPMPDTPVLLDLNMLDRPYEGPDMRTFVEFSSAILKAALRVIEFGDVSLSRSVDIKTYVELVFGESSTGIYDYNWKIESLNDVIKILLTLRYVSEPQSGDYKVRHINHVKRVNGIELIRRICIEEFSSMFLQFLLESTSIRHIMPNTIA